MNQNPDLLAREKIDHALLRSGWVLQSYKHKNIASVCIPIREYPTDTGPADFILFVNRKPVGVIEAKRPVNEVRLTIHGEKAIEYTTAKLKYLFAKTLSFVYKGTWNVLNFADYKDLRGDLLLMNAVYQLCFYIPRTPNNITNPL